MGRSNDRYRRPGFTAREKMLALLPYLALLGFLIGFILAKTG